MIAHGVMALALSGCAGRPNSPPPASVAGRGIGYAILGVAIDVVILLLVAPRLVPHE